MKKVALALVLSLSFVSFSQTKSAEAIQKDAFAQGSVQDSIDFLKNSISQCETKADKRAVLYLTGTMQEQLGLFTDAGKSYVQAAGISAPDAKGMKKVSTEQIVLDAVRCALCSGDYDNALTWLNSAVRSSKDEKISACVNLYTLWAQLCKCSTYEETKDQIELARAYSFMDSMKIFRPQLLFTLWYITAETEYAQQLAKNYPSSPEWAIIKNNAQVMSVPFWYFVPRKDKATTIAKVENIIKEEESKTAEKAPAPKVQVKETVQQKPAGKKRQQLGLYKNKANADEMISKLSKAGFKGYYFTETRSSGTTYYIVVVDENENGTMGKQLQSKGFDCYTVN